MAGAGKRAAGLVLVGALVMLIAPATQASVQTAGGLKYVTKQVELGALSTKTATASCPKGTRTIGGGERNGAAVGDLRLSHTFPYDDGDKGSKPDDGWRVRVTNSATAKRTFRVGAVCGDTKVRYRQEEFNVPATDQRDEDVFCPNDMFALSGGVEAAKNSPVYMNSSFPSDPGATGAMAWGAYVDNPGGATTATVHVVCGRRKPRIQDAAVSGIAPATQASASPSCPAGRLPYGGGQDNNGGYLAIETNSLGPLGTGQWLAAIDNFAAYMVNMTAYAVCGRPLN